MALNAPALAAGELYRIRVVGPESALPGEMISVRVVADATSYPDTTLPARQIQGFGFSLAIPNSMQIAGVSWGSDVNEVASGGSYGWQPGPSHWTFGATCTLPVALPNGLNLELVRLDVAVDGATEWGSTCSISIDDVVDPLFLTTGGPIAPHIRNATVMIGFSTECESEFPEPTAEEISTEQSESTGAVSGQGEGAGAGPEGTGYPSGTVYCNWETKGYLPGKPQYNVVSCCEVLGLQATIDQAIASVQDTVVLVEPGSYGSLVIDLAGLQAHVIVASEGGPEVTQITGIGLVPAVEIFGVPTGGSPRFTFGWHQADEIDALSPFDGGSSAAVRGWQGFEVTSGLRGVVVHDNILGVNPLVEIRGCYIHDNNGTSAILEGANVFLFNCGHVDVISNDISDSQARDRGAGISITDPYRGSKITIAKNYIHDNVCTGEFSDTQGGGIFASDIDTDICRNFIYRNEAVQGAGIFVSFTEGTRTFYVEANDVRDNVPSEADPSQTYRGGGISIEAAPGAFSSNWAFGLVRNRVFGNGKRVFSERIVAEGGGVFLNIDFADSLGPFGILGETTAGQLFVGNAIYQNTAVSRGGGLTFGGRSDFGVAPILFTTNTIWENVLVAGILGWGLFVPSAGGDNTFSSSNIIHDHEDSGPTDEEDWYAEVGSTFDPLKSSRTPDCAPPSLVDLFGPPPTSSVMPSLVENIAERRTYCRQLNTSETIDNAPVLYEPDHPRLGVDFDDQPRIFGVGMDIGADEFFVLDFRRGDANDDGGFNIADAIWILGSLFIPGTPGLLCLDAADVNDDGAVNIADAVFALNALFVPGAPQPPPPTPPNCGLDPTLEVIDCNEHASCP
ncbi:MAG: hypothetical protein ACKVX7_17260 [Planctomycetota bacterium]